MITRQKLIEVALPLEAVDRVELEPEHRELIPLFGRRLKELRPLGTDIRILSGSGTPLPRLPRDDQPEVT